ncbi:MAG: site-specific integrase [Gammaproteobacteria bacterium]
MIVSDNVLVAAALESLATADIPYFKALTGKQKEKLLAALRSGLTDCYSGSSPIAVPGKSIVSMLKKISKLKQKAEPTLRSVVMWLQREGHLVLDDEWALVVFPQSPVTPLLLRNRDRSRDAGEQLARKLADIQQMDKSEHALVALIWIIRFCGLGDSRAVVRMLKSVNPISLQLNPADRSLTLPNPKSIAAGNRKVLLDPVAWRLVQGLEVNRSWADLICNGNPKSSPTRLLDAYLAKLLPRPMNYKSEGLKERIGILGDASFLVVEQLLLAVSRGDVLSFADAANAVYQSRSASDRGIASNDDRSNSRELEITRCSRAIGFALARRDNSKALELVGREFPRDSIVALVVHAAIGWVKTMSMNEPRGFLSTFLPSLANAFGASTFEDFNEYELAEGFSDGLQTLDTESDRIRASHVIREMRTDRGRDYKFKLADVEGFGGRRLSVDTRLILETEYQAALDRLSNIADKRLALSSSTFLMVGYRLGLRPGEICRLQLRDIETGRWPTVRVRRRVKTQAARRWSPAFALLSDDEQKLLMSLVNTRIAEGAESTSLLFRSPSVPNPIRLSRRVAKALREVTGDRTMRLYQLRHSFSTRLFVEAFRDDDRRGLLGPLADWPRIPDRAFFTRILESSGWLYQIAYLLGHGSPKITMLHYIHAAHLALAIRLQPLVPRLSVAQVGGLLNRSRSVIYDRFQHAITDGKMAASALDDELH